jgi:PAS domain-containing protein
MGVIRKIWTKISFLGYRDDMPEFLKKELKLSNQISILLFPLLIAATLMELTLPGFFTATGFGLMSLICLLILFLNHQNKNLISRILLGVFPSMVILVPILINGVERIENYLGLGYIFIAFCMLPILLFNPKHESSGYWISIIVNVLIVLFFDSLLNVTAHVQMEDSYISSSYLFYKLPQLLLLITAIAALNFLKGINFETEEQLTKVNRELLDSNEEIQARTEEIITQNDELNLQQIKIQEQNDLLSRQNQELTGTKNELLKNIERLIEAKSALSQKEGESRSILDALKENFMVAEFDTELQLKWINDSFLESLSIDVDQLLQSDFYSNIIDVARKDKTNKEFEKQSQDDLFGWHPYALETPIKAKEGNDLWFSIIIIPITDDAAKNGRILAIGQDVTELYQQRTEIEQINKKLKDKITEIEQQNELLNFQQKEIFEKNEEMYKQQEEIQAINESLEERVKERTKVLEAKNKQLAEYAYINSHILRAPVSTMLGLLNLLSYKELQGDDKMIYHYLLQTANNLDDVVNRINTAIDNGFHFDRQYLYEKSSIDTTTIDNTKKAASKSGN